MKNASPSLLNAPLISVLFITFSFLLFNTCQKEEGCLEEDAFCDTTNEYMPLAVGNYWIYDIITFNTSTQSGTILSEQDTTRVIDVFISGTDGYFVIEKTYRSFPEKDTLYWRDSIGYIVNQKGDIMFSPTDFDRVLYTETISQPLGYSIDYSVKDSTIHFYTQNSDYYECLDYRGCFQRGALKDERPLHNYYAKNVGLVYKTTYSFSNPNSNNETRRELVEYHIENF